MIKRFIFSSGKTVGGREAFFIKMINYEPAVIYRRFCIITMDNLSNSWLIEFLIPRV